MTVTGSGTTAEEAGVITIAFIVAWDCPANPVDPCGKQGCSRRESLPLDPQPAKYPGASTAYVPQEQYADAGPWQGSRDGPANDPRQSEQSPIIGVGAA